MVRARVALVLVAAALAGPAAPPAHVVHLPAPAPAQGRADGLVGTTDGVISSLPKAFSTTRSDFSPDVTRWDPCTAIHWRINLAGSPRNAMADAKGAVLRLHRASGLHFVYDGTTSVVPDGDYGSDGDEAQVWPDLTIAFVSSGSTVDLPAGAAGVGGWHATSVSGDQGRSWQPRIVAGFVQVDRAKAAALGTGFGPGGTVGGLLMHELGHAVGLNHVGDPAQMMYPRITAKAAAYGKGDLAGLRAVGAANGCLPGLPPPGGYVRVLG